MSRVDSKIAERDRSGGRGFEGDAVAEAFELAERSATAVLGVVAGEEVVRAKVLVAGVGNEDVPGRDEQTMRDGGLGPFAAAADRHPPEQCMGVGVLLSDRAHRGWAERGLKPTVAGSGVGRFTSAGGLVVPGTGSCPGCEVGGGIEAGHVCPDLGDDHFSGVDVDPGIESSSSTSARYGSTSESIRVLSSAIMWLMVSMWSQIMRARKAW